MNLRPHAISGFMLAGILLPATHSELICHAQPSSSALFAVDTPGPSVPDSSTRSRAAAGHMQEELQLANDYYIGKRVARDLVQSAYWFRKAAEQGDPGAEVEIGYFYLTGTGVKADGQQAVRWFTRASASGSHMGKLNLAVAYLRGIGVPSDPHLGASLLSELAKEQDPRGEDYLGLVYMIGIGVEKNPATAEHWFELAAQHHSPEGNYSMGTLYTGVAGHARDLDRARRYFEQSVNGGYIPSKHSLGLLLVNHPELQQTPGEAVSLLQSAAAAGLWRSSVVLGILFRDGQGVLKDSSAAYTWFTIASQQGGSQAQADISADLAVFKSSLAAEERSKAEQAASQWMIAHPPSEVFVRGGNPAFAPVDEVYATEQAQIERRE